MLSSIPEAAEAKLTPWMILLPLVKGSANLGIKGSISLSHKRSMTFFPFVNLPVGPKGKSIPYGK